MERSPQFAIGDDLFVRDPQRYEPGCTCIVGPVSDITEVDGSFAYRIDASVGRMGGGYDKTFTIPERDVGLRPGTPLSQLSGRPGHRGYEAFKSIAASWGYD